MTHIDLDTIILCGDALYNSTCSNRKLLVTGNPWWNKCNRCKWESP